MQHYRRSIAKVIRAELARHLNPAAILDIQVVQADALHLTIVLRGSVGLDGAAMLAFGRRLRSALSPDAGLPQIIFRLRSDPVAPVPEIAPVQPDVAAAPLLATAARLIGSGLRPAAAAIAGPVTTAPAKRRGKPSPSAPSHWVG